MYNPYNPNPLPPLYQGFTSPRQYNTMQGSNIVWVQGREGAKAYQLAPSTNAILLDSENDSVFYIKSADNVGMCTMRTFHYEEVPDSANTQPEIKLDEYVKKDELKGMILDLISSITPPKPPESSVVKENTNEQIVPAIKRGKVEQYNYVDSREDLFTADS